MTTKFKIFAGSDGTSSENQKAEEGENKQVDQTTEGSKTNETPKKPR